MKVELVCTTDDPTDNLEYHIAISKGDFDTKVLPTFRSDNLFFIDTKHFKEYLFKLESCTSIKITSLRSLLKAINIRIDFFDSVGCKVSDYGITGKLVIAKASDEEVTAIFSKFLLGIQLTKEEVYQYRTYIHFHLARKYHDKGWVQQYHLGVIRNNNKRLSELFGEMRGVILWEIILLLLNCQVSSIN